MLLGDDAECMIVYNAQCSRTECMQSERGSGIYEMLHTNSHCQSRLVPVIELQRIVSKLYSIIIVDSVVL
jgi:hypothetical protein